jgi:hypothetical protein
MVEERAEPPVTRRWCGKVTFAALACQANSVLSYEPAGSDRCLSDGPTHAIYGKATSEPAPHDGAVTSPQRRLAD